MKQIAVGAEGREGAGRGRRCPGAAAARAAARMLRAWRWGRHCRACRASSRSSGCLSSASSVTGSSPSSAASAASRANTPAGVSASASPPDRRPRTCQRASAATTRRASARSGVTSAAVLPLVSTASRNATAMASASSSALAASMSVSVSSARGGGVEFLVGEALVPAFGGGGRPQRFRHQRLAAVGLRKRLDLGARDADAVEQRLHGELRVAGGGRAVVALVVGVAGDQRPGGVVEIRVEAGQHHRAVRQLSRWWRAAWRSPASSRWSRRRSPARRCRRAAWPRPRSVCRAARPLRWRSARPGSRASADVTELQEFQRLLPVFVELAGHQCVEAFHGTWRVIMSSISRASASASAIAASGVLAISGAPCSGVMAAAHLRISSASSRRRSSGGNASGSASACSPVAASAKAISSSSRSPSATMRGRMAASPSSRRGTPRAPAGRRAASADRAWRGRVRADRGWPESRAPVCRRATRRSAPAETAPRRGC